MKTFGLFSILSLMIIFSGCSKSAEEQIQEYMEFYYPTSGEYTYNIVFDWGEYEIFTGPKMDEQVHPDSEPFKGFITFRPYVTDAELTPAMPVYLITPDGEVWKTMQGSSIAENNTRKEVTEEKTDYGTSTQTRTINSSSEPVILSFKNDNGIWEKYGTLTVDAGKSSFTPAQKNNK